MKIQVNKVDGTSTKKGLKQNKIYVITGQNSKETVLPNGKIVDLSMFYTATDGKRTYELWNVHEDWSTLAIRKYGASRYSYTNDFTILSL